MTPRRWTTSLLTRPCWRPSWYAPALRLLSITACVAAEHAMPAARFNHIYATCRLLSLEGACVHHAAPRAGSHQPASCPAALAWMQQPHCVMPHTICVLCRLSRWTGGKRLHMQQIAGAWRKLRGCACGAWGAQGWAMQTGCLPPQRVTRATHCPCNTLPQWHARVPSGRGCI